MPRKKFIVFSILGIFAVAAAAFFWYGWRQLLAAPYTLIFGGENVLPKAILFAAGAIFFLTFLSLINLLVDDVRFRIAIFFFVSFVIFPIFQFDPKTLAVAFFFFLSLLLFSSRTQTQIKEHLHFSAEHLFGPSLGGLITLISVIFAIQYFFAAQANISQFRLEIPEYIFQEVTKIVPSVKGIQSGEVLQSQIQIPPELIPYIEKGEFPPEIAAEIEKYLPPGVTIDQVLGELQRVVKEQGGVITVPEEGIQQIEEYLGPLPEETKELIGMTSPLKQLVESQLEKIIEPYRKFIPAVFAALTFLLIKWFGTFVNFVSILLLAILIKILLWTKVAKVETETVQAERIVVE